MNWRILLAVALTGMMMAPATAVASHMTQYLSDPIEHDVSGQIPEPDGVVTSVLGFPVQNCVVELPVSGTFTGRCSMAHQATGTGLQPTGPIAPGCTGDNDGVQPVVLTRKVDGQCGLYDVGAPRPSGYWVPVVAPQIGPGKIPPPISEKGVCRSLQIGTGCQPGRYAGTIRFFDARVTSICYQALALINNLNQFTGTCMRDRNRLLDDLAKGGMSPAPGVVLPAIPNAPAPVPSSRVLAQTHPTGDYFLWAWYGEWNDLNGNGVIEACYHACRTNGDAGINEYVWLGGCMTFGNQRDPDSVIFGVCKEDTNPNFATPSGPCVDPISLENCANTTIHVWLWPGNHHGNGGIPNGDAPGNQVQSWLQGSAGGIAGVGPNLPGDCSHVPTCDEIAEDFNTGVADPLLDRQNALLPDGDFDDRTGDGVSAQNFGDVPSDITRHWAGYLGATTSYWDDGFLITLVTVAGVNCAEAPGLAVGFSINKAPGTTGACTSVDVDRYPTLSPMAQELLVGPDCNPATPDAECPTGGLKGLARSNWVILRGATPAAYNLESSIVDSNTVYQATQGPLRGNLDDQLLNNGLSREPNVGSASYKNAAGTTFTVSESYVGVKHTNCEAVNPLTGALYFPVGDSRNPTAGHDAESDEAAHRGFCNVHTSGAPQPAYRDYAQTILTPNGTEIIPRGWMDVRPVRGVLDDFSVTLLAYPCTYCVNGVLAPVHVNFNNDPESGTALPGIRSATDHSRTLGPGRYYFEGIVGLWNETKYSQDESVFPDPFGTTTVTYPHPGDAYPNYDGWIGTVARDGGQWRYRGFEFDICGEFATDKDPGSALGTKGRHDAAECNPYLDGNVDDPQDFTPLFDANGNFLGGEWNGGCGAPAGQDPEVNATLSRFNLAPKDGFLDTQIIAIANHDVGVGPLAEAQLFPAPGVFSYGPGPVNPLTMTAKCQSGVLLGTTFLYWPQGNLFDDMVVWGNAAVNRTALLPGVDNIVDVDTFAQYNLPVEVALPTLPDPI